MHAQVSNGGSVPLSGTNASTVSGARRISVSCSSLRSASGADERRGLLEVVHGVLVRHPAEPAAVGHVARPPDERVEARQERPLLLEAAALVHEARDDARPARE